MRSLLIATFLLLHFVPTEGTRCYKGDVMKEGGRTYGQLMEYDGSYCGIAWRFQGEDTQCSRVNGSASYATRELTRESFEKQPCIFFKNHLNGDGYADCECLDDFCNNNTAKALVKVLLAACSLAATAMKPEDKRILCPPLIRRDIDCIAQRIAQAYGVSQPVPKVSEILKDPHLLDKWLNPDLNVITTTEASVVTSPNITTTTTWVFSVKLITLQLNFSSTEPPPNKADSVAVSPSTSVESSEENFFAGTVMIVVYVVIALLIIIIPIVIMVVIWKCKNKKKKKNLGADTGREKSEIGKSEVEKEDPESLKSISQVTRDPLLTTVKADITRRQPPDSSSHPEVSLMPDSSSDGRNEVVPPKVEIKENNKNKGNSELESKKFGLNTVMQIIEKVRKEKDDSDEEDSGGGKKKGKKEKTVMRNISEARLLSLKFCSHLNNCSYFGNCMTFGGIDDAFCHCFPANTDNTCAKLSTHPPVVFGRTSALISDSPTPSILLGLILIVSLFLVLCLVWLVYNRRQRRPREEPTLKGVSVALRSVDDL